MMDVSLQAHPQPNHHLYRLADCSQKYINFLADEKLYDSNLISFEYLDLLNKGVAREIQVSAQYLLQHTKMEKISRKVIPENIIKYCI